MKYIKLVALLLLVGCSNPPNEFEQSVIDFADSHSNNSGVWSSGGTLHVASALTWQQASFQNKRATCSDFVNVLFSQQRLTFLSLEPHKIKTMSETLTVILNEKFAMSGTESQNKNRYKNKKVSIELAKIIKDIGWLLD